jgi:hypothetical protein
MKTASLKLHQNIRQRSTDIAFLGQEAGKDKRKVINS